MRTTTPDPLVAAYLRDLRARSRRLPRSQREELVQQIEEHLEAAIPPGAGEAEVRDTLDRLGAPEAIIAEQFDRLDIRPARAGKLEWAVVVLLPVGGVLIPILGWVLGVILLWASRVWTVRDKLIGTLLPPGGLSAIIFLIVIGASTCVSGGGPGQPTTERCTGGTSHVLGITLFLVFVVAGIGTPIYLARRASASRT